MNMVPKKCKDLTGHKYGRLTVASFSHAKDRIAYWNCVCDCGKSVLTTRQSLRSKHGTKSCGCLKIDQISKLGNNKLINLTGMKFGRLAVLGRFGTTDAGQVIWKCICECGNIKNVLGNSLKRGRTISCGCYHSKNHTKHGMSKSSIYKIWEGIIQRCTNPKNRKYSYYGERGITVCDRWKNFMNFFQDMGPRPVNLTIERRDNDKGYSPDNCYWATRSQQQKNRRTYKHKTEAIHGAT